MPRGQGIHVVPKGEKWGLDGQGAPAKSYPTQAAAIDAGKRAAQKQQTELLVHGRNGQIRMRNSYGNDPRRTKG